MINYSVTFIFHIIDIVINNFMNYIMVDERHMPFYLKNIKLSFY
jgi:hypothetical protein